MRTESFSYKLGQVMITFILVNISWIFFRMNSFGKSIDFIHRIATRWNPWVFFDQSLYGLGLTQLEIDILIVAIVILFLIDLVRYKKGVTIDIFLKEQCLWFRWFVILFMIFFIFIYGIYGPTFEASQFIYFQF